MCIKHWTNTNQYSSVWTESQPNNHITSILWYYLSHEQQETVAIQLTAHSSELASKHHLEGAVQQSLWKRAREQTACRTNRLWAPVSTNLGQEWDRGNRERRTGSVPAQIPRGIRKSCWTLICHIMEKGMGHRWRWGTKKAGENLNHEQNDGEAEAWELVKMSKPR